MSTSPPSSGWELLASVLGGATSGFCVDLAVYPMDTIKTRLQSPAHTIIRKGGGGLGLFAGLPAVILGSAPGAALFFFTYESVRRFACSSGAPWWLASMLSACSGDIVACIFRVPVETIKQRTQNQPSLNARIVLSQSLKSEGWRGLYRGYVSQVSRGFPFCIIQYPTWEFLKNVMEKYNRQRLLNSGLFSVEVEEESRTRGREKSSLTKAQYGICGALAGAIGGTCTTPMDVAKTRIMLAEKDSPLASGNVLVALRTIYQEGGVPGLFAGVVPRVCIMSFGGAIFLGLYDITRLMWLARLTLDN